MKHVGTRTGTSSTYGKACGFESHPGNGQRFAGGRKVRKPASVPPERSCPSRDRRLGSVSLRSSVVEQATLNGRVPGSNPGGGTVGHALTPVYFGRRQRRLTSKQRLLARRRALLRRG